MIELGDGHSGIGKSLLMFGETQLHVVRALYDEWRILYHVVADLQRFAADDENYHNKELALAFRTIRETQSIPTWTVFAFQLLLDIQGILLQDYDSGFKEPQAFSERAVQETRQHMQFMKTFRGTVWAEEMRSNLMKL